MVEPVGVLVTVLPVRLSPEAEKLVGELALMADTERLPD